mmetsp:Transcript_73225/g.174519  ORF Transcript_73225/g.174519 Transcript_73225/m.174519 type:complete len:377 (-) Transcript_73225:224-1354(-)
MTAQNEIRRAKEETTNKMRGFITSIQRPVYANPSPTKGKLVEDDLAAASPAILIQDSSQRLGAWSNLGQERRHAGVSKAPLLLHQERRIFPSLAINAPLNHKIATIGINRSSHVHERTNCGRAALADSTTQAAIKEDPAEGLAIIFAKCNCAANPVQSHRSGAEVDSPIRQLRQGWLVHLWLGNELMSNSPRSTKVITGQNVVPKVLAQVHCNKYPATLCLDAAARPREAPCCFPEHVTDINRGRPGLAIVVTPDYAIACATLSVALGVVSDIEKHDRLLHTVATLDWLPNHNGHWIPNLVAPIAHCESDACPGCGPVAAPPVSNLASLIITASSPPRLREGQQRSLFGVHKCGYPVAAHVVHAPLKNIRLLPIGD